ncbi:MAG: hypothetical protein PHU62_04995 [Bacteroidales bacterium]|jgi:pyruvate, orthophosphate dikinase|nr:hypothetical protein [Bacteroidales bacterium]MDD2204658.1 hypothetical protein [Bacteroidales bacterium]MDD3913667.1 hypothetical protein [Bacteroidales bacterium]MDD4633918.1 hypothetical protein [Bacteroidales bacterium]
MVTSYRIRANYPDYFIVKLYVDMGRSVFEKEKEYEGNKPGTVIYTYRLEDGTTVTAEIAPRWYDIFYLLNNDYDKSKHYIDLLIQEQEYDSSTAAELEGLRIEMYDRCTNYIKEHPLYDDDLVVTTLTEQDFTKEFISHKGNVLLALTKLCYPVPDFCILSAKAYQQEDQSELLKKAIYNLEVMTESFLGSATKPLIFALRSAMPQYIPGLMPTLLNVGVTSNVHNGLIKIYDENMANRIYLNTLHGIFDILSIDITEKKKDIELNIAEQRQRIKAMEKNIHKCNGGSQIIEDAFAQVLAYVNYIRDFYKNNQDLLSTFMQGKIAYPALIMQKMVWTIGNDYSYPGVLYSRHSRTGLGCQIESYRNIFGEEIMTGDIQSNDIEFFDREEVKDSYPAIYHFAPLLPNLERRFKSPVTIEFGVETRQNITEKQNVASLFAVLQLNESELTGRAALLSSINMYEKEFIGKEDVVALVRPYHLRQIFSDSIDSESMNQLVFFSKAVNVLPRTAVTVRIYFNTANATNAKQLGVPVCLCKERFLPEDTIILSEMDAILSMTPAAIHVVTACRGYGIPAFLNLESFGVSLSDNKLINKDGLEIKEGDWITLSSRQQTIFIGKANYKPARFMDYLNGKQFLMDEKEEKVFIFLKEAYQKYNQIVTSTKVNYITDVNTLTRLIKYDLQDHPETAAEIANNWFAGNSAKYLRQVLESKMGSHQDQSRVFNLLDNGKKIEFFKNAVAVSTEEQLSGLTAGAFILGRFIAQPLPSTFWEAFDDKEIAFMLNEYVLYEKYIQVLNEVGETKLTKVHSKIVSEGLTNWELNNFSIEDFLSLKKTNPNWNKIAEDAKHLLAPQKNTGMLIEKLSCPYKDLFDMSKSWNVEMLKKAGIYEW